jgi:hypothetical protein
LCTFRYNWKLQKLWSILEQRLEKQQNIFYSLVVVNQRAYKRNYFPLKRFCSQRSLFQPRATQIGSRAKILLNSHVEGQSIWYFYRFSQFFYEIAIFQKLWKGRTRELKGLMRPAGRRLPMAGLFNSRLSFLFL